MNRIRQLKDTSDRRATELLTHAYQLDRILSGDPVAHISLLTHDRWQVYIAPNICGRAG